MSGSSAVAARISTRGWPARTTSCPLTAVAAGDCSGAWLPLTLSDVTLSLTGLPTYACVADAFATFIAATLNSTAGTAALASAVIHGALPGAGLAVGYGVPGNVRVSLGPASVSAPAIAACAGSSQSLTLAQLTGFDVRALPASYAGNTLGTGIAVIASSACAAVAGTALACQSATFSIGGASFNLVNTLAALNMAAV